jgi:hypothetical protein
MIQCDLARGRVEDPSGSRDELFEPLAGDDERVGAS